MPLDTAVIAEAASLLRGAAETGRPCAPVRHMLAGGGPAEAYAVQLLNTRHALGAGRRPVGRKIGLTSKAIQRQLGVDQPDFGILFADMAFGDGEELPTPRLLQPRIEGEIAFCIGRDLADPGLTHATLMRSIDYAVAALEIVDSRVAGWDISILDTIADNASSGLFVLGCEPRRLGDFDPWACGMVLEQRGEPVSTGAGAACLGNPLNAVLWLARTMIANGTPLAAGDIVLSGALGPMVPARPGDAFELRVSGLGSVRALFAGA